MYRKRKAFINIVFAVFLGMILIFWSMVVYLEATELNSHDGALEQITLEKAYGEIDVSIGEIVQYD